MITIHSKTKATTEEQHLHTVKMHLVSLTSCCYTGDERSSPPSSCSPSSHVISILIDNLTWRPWWHRPQSIRTVLLAIRSPWRSSMMAVVDTWSHGYWWWGTTVTTPTSTWWTGKTANPSRATQIAILTTPISFIKAPCTSFPLTAPTHTSQSPLITPLTRRSLNEIPITLFQMQIYLLDNEFALLVLLTRFIGLGVSPPD